VALFPQEKVAENLQFGPNGPNFAVRELEMEERKV
jgi:hypothetical protein